jgi:hypothetical protein
MRGCIFVTHVARVAAFLWGFHASAMCPFALRLLGGFTGRCGTAATSLSSSIIMGPDHLAKLCLACGTGFMPSALEEEGCLVPKGQDSDIHED